jgi:hypothetical protein
LRDTFCALSGNVLVVIRPPTDYRTQSNDCIGPTGIRYPLNGKRQLKGTGHANDLKLIVGHTMTAQGVRSPLYKAIYNHIVKARRN